MEISKKRQIRAEKALEEAVESFEKQYIAKLGWTGFYNVDEGEDGIIVNREYFAHDLAISKVNEFDIEVGGWFSCDYYNGTEEVDRISCLLSVKNKVIGDVVWQGEYNLLTKRWRLYWTSL